ncbi:MAG: hypothetical protein ABF508_04585 [Zymomonas mobilis]|nr:hypothetical protein [Zymomonas mobilis]
MTPPPQLPAFPHNPDNRMTAAEWLQGSINLYETAGSIRLQLLALQAAVQTENKTNEPK